MNNLKFIVIAYKNYTFFTSFKIIQHSINVFETI